MYGGLLAYVLAKYNLLFDILLNENLLVATENTVHEVNAEKPEQTQCDP